MDGAQKIRGRGVVGARWAVTALALVSLLSGCLKVDTGLKIRSDGKVDVVYTFAFDMKAVRDIAGANSVPKFRTSVKSSVRSFKAQWPAGAKGTIKFTDNVSYVGYTATFSGATPEQLDAISLETGKLETKMVEALTGGEDENDPNDPDRSLFGSFTIVNDGATITFGIKPGTTTTSSTTTTTAPTGAVAPPATADGSSTPTTTTNATTNTTNNTTTTLGDNDEALNAFLDKYPGSVVLKVTFPGKIISANGSIKGKTVTWKSTVRAEEVDTVSAVANAR